jgi:PAS domain-containing protein
MQHQEEEEEEEEEAHHNNNNNNNNNEFLMAMMPNNDMENVLPADLTHHPAVRAFQVSGASFLVTNPRLPGNPIIYASPGFLELTGYGIDRVLGRNCRFLQGPETDPAAVSKMREALDRGLDVRVCLLNYRHDGSTFYNQILISGVRTPRPTPPPPPIGGGQEEEEQPQDVKYFLGVQCLVKAPTRVVDGLSSSSSDDDGSMQE